MYYLAYGSNLHPLRLGLRAPDSRLLGTTRLDGCRLTFGKRSSDGSTKCNLERTGNPGDIAHGAVFEIPKAQIQDLDAAEGLGFGYHKRTMTVGVAGSGLEVFVYIASASHLVDDGAPYHWYKGFVLAGARWHGFPDSYVEGIAAVTSKDDPDATRRDEMHRLLARFEAR